MALEASIIQKLDDLKKWQVEQQEKLLKQQHNQRQLLNTEAERLYEALESSMKSLMDEEAAIIKDLKNKNIETTQTLSDDNGKDSNRVRVIQKKDKPNEKFVNPPLNVPNVQLKGSDNKQMKLNTADYIKFQVNVSNKNSEKVDENLKKKNGEYQVTMKGVKPLLQFKSSKPINIDDIPVNSSKKDFKSLLEEKIKDSEMLPLKNRNENVKKNIVKRPFLKKGEGLARFRMKLVSDGKAIKNHRIVTVNQPETINDVDKNKGKIMVKQKIPEKLNLKSLNPSNKQNFPVNNKQIDLKFDDNDKVINESDDSHFDTKVFEFLEEKAENSSFCSTSSAVLTFMQQSTPLKLKNIRKNLLTANKKNLDLDTQVQINNKNKMFNDVILSKSPNILENLQNISSSTCVESSSDQDNKNESNTSIHVRFSEHNEYKTIELTDSSVITVKDSFDGDDWTDQSQENDSSESSEIQIVENKNYFSGITNYKAIVDQIISSTSGENTESSKNNSIDEEESTFIESEMTGDDDEEEEEEDENDTITSLQDDIIQILNQKTDFNPKNDNKNYEMKPNTSIKRSKEGNDEKNDTIFKSELLKNRLQELEREIDIFRKENATLLNQRQKLHDEQIKMQKEFKLKSESLEKEKNRMENNFQEEKNRLAREKAALQNRLLDAREKSLQAKQERLDIQKLKETIDELRETMNANESRSQAIQARQKSQIRVLQMENSKLKEELERLRTLKQPKGKIKKPISTINKAIHQINKQLDDCRSNQNEEMAFDDKKLSPRIYSCEDFPSSSNSESIETTDDIKIIEQKQMENIHRKISPDHYKNNYLDKLPISPNQIVNDVKVTSPINFDNFSEISDEVKRQDSLKNINNTEKVIDNPKSQLTQGSYQQFVRQVVHFKNETSPELRNHQLPKTISYKPEEIKSRINDIRTYKPQIMKDDDRNSQLTNEMNDQQLPKSKVNFTDESELSPRKIYPNNKIHNPHLLHFNHQSSMKNNDKQGKPETMTNIREVKHLDGHIEYWYPNGNVKKYYPDRNITKMIYYNGDVRETNSDGCVKYFYAASKTWHTTYPDGFEIIEFPDGQQERRTKDGIIEVSFPDGSIRLIHPDNSEKWALPDGTIAEIFTNGDKIFTFPNKQREIHSSDHKRREYPDGSVKYVYPDGTQKAQYANGRLRIKDKDGNLVVDSHRSY